VNPEAGPTILPGFGITFLPFLVSVSSSAARINVGARPARDGSLGKRASITITMQDAPHTDNLVDPYLSERTFDPLERSTFWAKWLARNPYFNGRAIQVITGYLGQIPDEYLTQHYIIDKIEGPDPSGRVTIRCSDILRLADDNQAKAPELSVGQVWGDFTAGATFFSVAGDDGTGYAVGDGILRVENEVITYATGTYGAGIWVFSGCARGARDTEASDHKDGATVQRCLDVVDLKAYEVIYALLTQYAGIQTNWIDLPAWAAEADKWTGNFVLGRLLTTPIGVAKMIGQICEQSMLYIWWDPEAQKIKLRAVRPALPEELVEISEDFNLIQGKSKITVRPEERLTEVWVSWGLRSPILPEGDRSSYANTRKRADAAAASDEEYGQRRVYEILSPWLISDSQVSPLSYRMLAAYRDNPAYFSGWVDAKDRDIAPASVVDLTARAFVDREGAQEARRFEVIQREEVIQGEAIRLELQPSQFTNRYAYIMADATLDYSDYTAVTRPELGCWFCAPDIAGPAEYFPDGLPPFVFI